MNDPRFVELTEKKMTVSTVDCVISFIALDVLLQVATEQMQFPAWRNANPHRTEQVIRAIAAVKSANLERGERCLEFAKALTEASDPQIQARNDDQPLG